MIVTKTITKIRAEVIEEYGSSIRCSTEEEF